MRVQDLGIPTANVDSSSLGTTLAEAVTGIYAGWASVGPSPEVYPMVMSIGWNPFYGNKEKTAEPWILHHFDQVAPRPDCCGGSGGGWDGPRHEVGCLCAIPTAKHEPPGAGHFPGTCSARLLRAVGKSAQCGHATCSRGAAWRRGGNWQAPLSRIAVESTMTSLWSTTMATLAAVAGSTRD
jgi:hypothetical protein